MREERLVVSVIERRLACWGSETQRGAFWVSSLEVAVFFLSLRLRMDYKALLFWSWKRGDAGQASLGYYFTILAHPA